MRKTLWAIVALLITFAPCLAASTADELVDQLNSAVAAKDAKAGETCFRPGQWEFSEGGFRQWCTAQSFRCLETKIEGDRAITHWLLTLESGSEFDFLLFAGNGKDGWQFQAMEFDNREGKLWSQSYLDGFLPLNLLLVDQPESPELAELGRSLVALPRDDNFIRAADGLLKVKGVGDEQEVFSGEEILRKCFLENEGIIFQGGYYLKEHKRGALRFQLDVEGVSHDFFFLVEGEEKNWQFLASESSPTIMRLLPEDAVQPTPDDPETQYQTLTILGDWPGLKPRSAVAIQSEVFNQIDIILSETETLSFQQAHDYQFKQRAGKYGELSLEFDSDTKDWSGNVKRVKYQVSVTEMTPGLTSSSSTDDTVSLNDKPVFYRFTVGDNPSDNRVGTLTVILEEWGDINKFTLVRIPVYPGR
jgi:hypothetical protein